MAVVSIAGVQTPSGETFSLSALQQLLSFDPALDKGPGASFLESESVTRLLEARPAYVQSRVRSLYGVLAVLFVCSGFYWKQPSKGVETRRKAGEVGLPAPDNDFSRFCSAVENMIETQKPPTGFVSFSGDFASEEEALFTRIPQWRSASAFVRAFREGVVTTEFSLGPMDFEESLTRLMELMFKPSVWTGEVIELVHESERLANYAMHNMSGPVDCSGPPASYVTELGKRFLLLNVLQSAARVAPNAMEISEWWPTLAKAVVAKCTCKSKGLRNTCRVSPLAQRLQAAIDLYRKEQAPTAEEVASLKKILFSGSWRA